MIRLWAGIEESDLNQGPICRDLNEALQRAHELSKRLIVRIELAAGEWHLFDNGQLSLGPGIEPTSQFDETLPPKHDFSSTNASDSTNVPSVPESKIPTPLIIPTPPLVPLVAHESIGKAIDGYSQSIFAGFEYHSSSDSNPGFGGDDFSSGDGPAPIPIEEPIVEWPDPSQFADHSGEQEGPTFTSESGLLHIELPPLDSGFAQPTNRPEYAFSQSTETANKAPPKVDSIAKIPVVDVGDFEGSSATPSTRRSGTLSATRSGTLSATRSGTLSDSGTFDALSDEPPSPRDEPWAGLPTYPEARRARGTQSTLEPYPLPKRTLTRRQAPITETPPRRIRGTVENLQQAKSERRSAPRFTLATDLPIRVAFRQKTVSRGRPMGTVELLDLSMSGARLRVDGPVRPSAGQVVVLEVTAFDRVAHLAGKLRWGARGHYGLEFDSSLMTVNAAGLVEQLISLGLPCKD